MATTPDEPEPDPAPTPGPASSARVVVQPPRPTWPAIVLVALVGIAGLVVLFWFVPELVPEEAGGDPVRAARTTGVATLRAAVLAGGLGLAAVLTLMFNARTAHTAEQNLHLTRQAQEDAREEAERSAEATRENIELTRRAQDDARTEAQRQAETTRESLQLTRQAQIAERYSAAIELLAGKNTDGAADADTTDTTDGADTAGTADTTDGADTAGTARTTAELGGIYALEQLARESRDYRAIVVEVLSAFVRGRAALRPDQKVAWHRYGPDRERVAPHLKDPPTLDHSASTLAALAVLGRVAPPQSTVTTEIMQAVSTIDGIERSRAIRADLHKTNLRGVDLTRGGERGPNFSYAAFDGADLTRTFFLAANLHRATFHGTDLTGAFLGHADLTGAYLRFAWLNGTHLTGTDLRGADLGETHGLVQEQIEAASGDVHTVLPEGLRRPASWENAGD